MKQKKLCQFEGIEIFLDKTDFENIYPAESTRIFLKFPTFYCVLKVPRLSIFFNPYDKMFQILVHRNETFSVP